jgi:hypothetical protein
MCKADNTQESLRQLYKEHVAPFTRLAKAVEEHLEAVQLLQNLQLSMTNDVKLQADLMNVQIAQQERSNFCHVVETTANEYGKHNKKTSPKTRKSLSYFEKTQNVLSTFNSIRK